MEDLLTRALDAAVRAGADYADVRGTEAEMETLSVRGSVVESLERSDSLGFGVRVLSGGSWGYACSARLEPAEVERVARAAVEVARAGQRARVRPVELAPEPVHRDEWVTPLEIDPFGISLEDKVSLLLRATEPMDRLEQVRVARGTMDFHRQHTLFVSSEGSRIDQTIFHTGAGIEAIAIADGQVQQRSYPGSFRGHFAAGGYEVVERMDLAANADRTADEAVALLSASECPSVVTTLVIDGHQTMLQVHESVGHPTELDRVLGMEAAFAGTSFVEVDDLGQLRYGSDHVTITADATIPGGLGTYAYDDEGVEGQKVTLIDRGLLTGLQTSRETAGAVGVARSNGTMRAEGWEHFPLIRMTNINLLPGAGSLEDLFADVDDGIFMATNKSWSIDDKRKNFQFGCEIAWEIKNGRIGKMLRDPRYTGITPRFWNSCDGVAGEDEWRMWGTPNCGKGQPGQTMRVGHGTSPSRFRNVSIGVAQ